MNFNLDSLIDVHEVALIKDKVAGSKFTKSEGWTKKEIEEQKKRARLKKMPYLSLIHI